MLYSCEFTPAFEKSENARLQRKLSRRLLFFGMEKEYGIKPDYLQLARGEHGKPYFLNHRACFSLSHSDGLLLCDLSESETGADCERVRECSQRLMDRVCTPGELFAVESSANPALEFTTLWTLKESMMKLTGLGMAMGFKNAAFIKGNGAWRPENPEVKCASFFNVPGYVISVCRYSVPPESLIRLSDF